MLAFQLYYQVMRRCVGPLLLLMLVGCGSAESDTASTTTVTDTVTVRAAPVDAPAGKAALSVDGMYRVGMDVQPGVYQSAGPVDPRNECYWQRVSTLSGDSSGVLAFNFSAGQQVVEILPGDVGFQTKNCQPWVKQ